MCYNCGCFNPNDDMGHDDNITNQTLSDIAKQQGKSPDVLKKELLIMLNTDSVDSQYDEVFSKAAKAWGQSVDDAKKETQKLLTQELKGK